MTVATRSEHVGSNNESTTTKHSFKVYHVNSCGHFSSNEKTTPVISNRGSPSVENKSSTTNTKQNGPPPFEWPKAAVSAGKCSPNSILFQKDYNGNRWNSSGEEQLTNSALSSSSSNLGTTKTGESVGSQQPRFSPANSPPIILDEWVFSTNKASVSSVPKNISVKHNPSTIRGIPNFGQTCFLSSVLQSLASLTAFNIYLSTHIRSAGIKQRSFSSFQFNDESNGSSSHYLTRLLWEGLQHINGKTESASTSAWDPRALLDVVGQSHKQFESIHQQQDAQELLTALLDVLVQEQELRRSLRPVRRKNRSWLGPRLPTTPEPEPVHFSYSPPAAAWAISPSFLRLQLAAFVPGASAASLSDEAVDETGYDFDDDMISVASSARESARLRRRRRSQSVCDSSSNKTSLANYEQPDKGWSTDTAKLPEMNGTSEKMNGSFATTKDHTLTSTNRGEEKKQEEFEQHVPRKQSEGDLTMVSFAENDELDNENDSETVSALSSSGIIRPVSHTPSHLTAATQMRQPQLRSSAERLAMPLCGWMGSTLQCRTCCYVRPIQNVPFIDISVIPTGVARPYAASKDGSNKPCTVEECLSDFTKVERVEQVDCPSCTKQEHETKVQEEVDFWQFTLDDATNIQQTKLRRGCSAKCGDLQSIREELDRHSETLRQWRQINCDDADCASQISKLLGTERSDGKPPSNILLRRDASKCLFLTRLPPVLCLHVQRRYYDAQTARLSKTTQPVLFDEYLNVAPYCAYTTSLSSNGPGSPGCFQKHRAAAPSWIAGSPTTAITGPSAHIGTQRQIYYRLMAVLEHFGGANSGHYVCYRRSPTGEWWYVSDNIVRQVSWQRVRQCQAYMLFYENSNISEHDVS
ncbi:hypothetical protein ACA910_012500 [Epithemia clementina (nom. ined.)]